MSTTRTARPTRRSGTGPDERLDGGNVAHILRRAAADEARFRMAYKLGFEAGREVGRLQLDHELTEQDRLRMRRMHGLATTPAYRDLERIRWDGRREDFGRPRPGDFPGVQKRGAA